MSVDSNTSTDSIDPINSPDPQPLIGSDLLTDGDLSRKQQAVLVARAAFVGRHDVSFSAIAEHAQVSVPTVRYTLSKFMDRGDLPADCRVFERCTPTKSYEDLTELQRSIVNELVINDHLSYTEISDIVGCSVSHVQTTNVIYSDIVEARRKKVCE